MLTSDQIKAKIESYLFDNLGEWKDQINLLSKSETQKQNFRKFIATDLTKKAKLIYTFIEHLTLYAKDFDAQEKLLIETIALLDCLTTNPSSLPNATPAAFTEDQQTQLEKLNAILSEVPPSHATTSVE